MNEYLREMIYTKRYQVKVQVVHIVRQVNSSGLSVMSGLARNPANREITSSSGTSEHQDIFFSIFFNFFLASFSQKTWKKYDLTRPKVSKYSLTS
jgi:hypothetical protein